MGTNGSNRTILNDHFVCPVCHLGHLDLRLTVYVRMFGETLIHVPNMPAWECDVCHHRQFDPASIQRIEMLVGQAGPPPNRYRPPAPPRIGRAVDAALQPVAARSVPKASKPRAKAKPD